VRAEICTCFRTEGVRREKLTDGEDHYCPWVGGAVSETNNKFFLQFAAYGTTYAVFVFVVTVWIIVRSKRDVDLPFSFAFLTTNIPQCDAAPACTFWSPSGHWIVGVVMGVMFGFMGFGIAARFSQFAATNATTVEELQRGHPSDCLAVRVDPSELPRHGDERGFFWVRYPFGPDPPPPAAALAEDGVEGVGAESGDGRRPRREREYVYFAILQPRAGVNPWDVGAWANWRGLMGAHVWDWVLPLRSSPSVIARRRRHARRRGARDDAEAGAGAHLVCDFPLGKDFEELERAFLPHRYRGGKRVVPLRAEDEEEKP
jgi:palmitoyltransferase